jgi:putative ABC transport system permease protein
VQFLTESTVLSASGGLIGVFVGVTGPIVVTSMSDIQTALSWWAIMIAFGFSVIIGMAAGVYPAFRAALLDPIEALRHE